MLSSLALAALPALALAAPFTPQNEKRAIAQSFVPPSKSPLEPSANYVGQNNGTLKNPPYKKGKAFDRIIQIWLENTDYDSAASTPAFQELQKTGQTLSNYVAITHPSEPEYMAAVYGDFFGMPDDSFYYVPENITSLFDLLDNADGNPGGISFSCYEEQLPFDGFTGINYTSHNYLSANAPNYTYYERKHNPCAFGNSFSGNKTRAIRNRNFNDLAADIKADALPQWVFITPNMVNDGHDTNPQFFSDWLEYFMPPLLAEPKFNSSRTLIVLTFDENEDYSSKNRMMTILMGGALPQALRNTTEDQFMSHYSMLSTVEANWGLKNLGRGDVNKTMANVIPFVSEMAGLKGWNNPVAPEDEPQTNLTGIFAGPLNSEMWIPFVAPDDINVIGAGGQGVLIKDGLNTSLTFKTAPPSINLTAMHMKNPYNTDPGFNNADLSTAPKSKSGGDDKSSASSLVYSTLAGAGALSAAIALLL